MEPFGATLGSGVRQLALGVDDLALPAEFSLDTMNEFIDWNRKVPFQVIRGEGECAM